MKNFNLQKKEKILITGGLGYIGTQLCKLYSSETLKKDILVIDNRFLPERIKKLKEWGIRFIELDILNKEKLKDLIEGFDIVYHLAGITDVAYTKTESNSVKDELIRICGTTGSKNIIEFCSDKTKIVFPSTHVVFEGLNENLLEIEEDRETLPVLTYSRSKAETERNLINSGKNYIILRLGSAYGYGGDSMRIKIMPNLFSKIASQKGTIKLFSRGIQNKSLVSVRDVARCMKFVGENKQLNKEIFHCVNENTTVRNVAQKCKELVPEIELIETEDKIPNKGYTLSNKKILSTGFEFKDNLEDSITKMIRFWDNEREFNREPLVNVFRGSKEFKDERGRILNYELPEYINWVGWIESKKGVLRANHYHPIQEQKCILLKGKYLSVTKDLEVPNALTKTKIIQEGDLEVIKSNVAHTMVFLEDSFFLNLVNGEREHENFGKHTIPYLLVDQKHQENILKNSKVECRVCENKFLKRVISLGYSPLANNLLNSPDQKFEVFPLEMDYCPNCYNCQLSHVVPPEKMFNDYLYLSSTSDSFKKHFESAAEKMIEKYNLDSNSFVVDIGSNDGIFLKPLKKRGIKICGIDPASKICDLANESEIKTIKGYFNEEICEKIIEEEGHADLVTAFNVFAHSDKLKVMVKDAFKLLKKGGSFVIEVQYLLDTLKDRTFDNIYHEHVNYWSVTSLNNFFKILGLQISFVEHVDTHGGSIRVHIQEENFTFSNSLNEFLKREIEFGIKNHDTYLSFAKKIEDSKKIVLDNLFKIKKSGKKIVGYGAPAKATTILNYYGISKEDLEYTVEDNSLKHNKYIPGTGIYIMKKERILENPPEYILVLAWNFFEEIKKNNSELVDYGCKFITLKDLEQKDFFS